METHAHVGSIHFFLCSALLLVVVVASGAASCSEVCGNTSIPYPFGLAPGCGVPELQLNCSSTGVPSLQTINGEFQVLNITSSTIIINTTDLKAVSCNGSYIADGTANFSLGDSSAFVLSGNNRFFVNGCHAAGSFTTDISPSTSECQTGCVNDNPQYSFCNIYSCCVAPIPTGSRSVLMRGGGVAFKAGGCSYSSMVFPPSYVTINQSVIGSGTYGVELLWAVPEKTCDNATTSLCSANSTCLDVEAVPGSICECQDGFSGDGYLNGTGCSWVDNCLDSSSKCAPNSHCISTIGSYSCNCKSGFFGDGKLNGSGCTPVKSNVPVILGSVAAAAALTSIACCCIWRLKKQRKRRKLLQNHVDRNLKSMRKMQSILSSANRKDHANLFSYEELQRATKGFRKDLKLGSGGFGTVYKGTLNDNTVVAVKRANHVGAKGSEQFLNEVTILSQVNHRNLVRLMGCCIETEIPLLVYEYVSNGTLFEHLQGEKGKTLSWEKRLQIAIETAEALSYLHSAAFPPIYHRDVKSSNILLDETLAAKVADFGISKLVPVEATHVSTAVQGTPGYLDPEYFRNYQLTDKSDVYSFGVVLLEMITGQKPVDFSRTTRDVNLVTLTMPLIQKDMVEDILDPKLEALSGSEVTASVKMVASLAAECLAFASEDRPNMKQVLEELLRIRGSTRTTTLQGRRLMSTYDQPEFLVDGLRNVHDLMLFSGSTSGKISSCSTSVRTDTAALLPR